MPTALLSKLLTGGSGAEMADAGALSEGDMVVKEDGYLYDQQGSRLAGIAGGSEPTQDQPATFSGRMESRGADNGGGHMLGDAGFDDFGGGFEQGEAFTAWWRYAF
ncbi:hypothetical protein [Fodinibius sp.]|uniref:hypothetical protein n=1 Tax=Fodinibius sp. TaxID=1872440 RepID=UPI002ACDA6FE|nr:hypothetical protein [Fodinibius sp.]MDZ7658832.1 hypothetical protein [Fodinibius sp.]